MRKVMNPKSGKRGKRSGAVKKRKEHLDIYIREPRTKEIFQLLKNKWFMEKKIQEPSLSAAFVYMVTHFGRIETGSGNNGGGLQFDSQRRQKVDMLSRLLQLGHLIPDGSDASVLNYIIDYAWNVHKSETVFERILGGKR